MLLQKLVESKGYYLGFCIFPRRWGKQGNQPFRSLQPFHEAWQEANLFSGKKLKLNWMIIFEEPWDPDLSMDIVKLQELICCNTLQWLEFMFTLLPERTNALSFFTYSTPLTLPPPPPPKKKKVWTKKYALWILTFEHNIPSTIPAHVFIASELGL